MKILKYCLFLMSAQMKMVRFIIILSCFYQKWNSRVLLTSIKCIYMHDIFLPCDLEESYSDCHVSNTQHEIFPVIVTFCIIFFILFVIIRINMELMIIPNDRDVLWKLLVWQRIEDMSRQQRRSVIWSHLSHNFILT